MGIPFFGAQGFLGTATNGGGVASSCLSLDKTEPTMITKEMYEKLQHWCKPYLRKEYEELRKEYEELRRPFNNYLKLSATSLFTPSMKLKKSSFPWPEEDEVIKEVGNVSQSFNNFFL